MMFIVTPIEFNTVMPMRKEPGIAKPTSDALRIPSTARTTTITMITAAPTLLPRSLSRLRTSLESSKR